MKLHGKIILVTGSGGHLRHRQGDAGGPDSRAGGTRGAASNRANGVSPGWIATDVTTGHEEVDRVGLTITDYPSQPWLDAEGAWKLFPQMQPKQSGPTTPWAMNAGGDCN